MDWLQLSSWLSNRGSNRVFFSFPNDSSFDEFLLRIFSSYSMTFCCCINWRKSYCSPAERIIAQNEYLSESIWLLIEKVIQCDSHVTLDLFFVFCLIWNPCFTSSLACRLPITLHLMELLAAKSNIEFLWAVAVNH